MIRIDLDLASSFVVATCENDQSEFQSISFGSLYSLGRSSMGKSQYSLPEWQLHQFGDDRRSIEENAQVSSLLRHSVKICSFSLI